MLGRYVTMTVNLHGRHQVENQISLVWEQKMTGMLICSVQLLCLLELGSVVQHP